MSTNIAFLKQRIVICVAGTGLLMLCAASHADEALRVEEVAPILKKHPCAKTCKVHGASFVYTLTPIDLNGDGTAEYLVRDEACGSGGCAEGFFMRQGNGWKKLLGVSVGGLEVSNRRTNGFADVVIWQMDYDPQKHEVRTTYRWDGQRYRDK
ncbi:MAG: hypothetical protein WBO95_13845 [Candidatus Dechloromonas phosphoritropha]|jgi:hypothetical protein